ncbi:MAG: O-antigen ligase family protein [Fibrella sp.]|nr:O-antigen ligase family protein [Armatimonadota bacterium]
MVSPAPGVPASSRPITRPATPWWMYVVGVLGAVAVGVAAAFPKAFVAVLILGLVAVLLVGAVRNPWIALAVIIAQYPVMNTLRTIYTAHHLPVFAGGVRFFPDFLQMIILAQLLIWGIKNPRYRLKIYGDDLPVALYVIVGIYSVVVAAQYTHPYGPFNGWYVSMTPAIFYLVIRWLQPTHEQGMWFFRWMTRCYGVLMCLSLPVYFIRPDWYKVLQNAEHPHFVPPGMTPMAFWGFYPRMQAFFFEENHWGTLSELVAVLGAAYLMRSDVLLKRYVFVLLATLGMVCSISRGAMISFVIAIAILLLFRGAHRKRIAAVLAVSAVVGVAGLYAMRDSPLVTVTFDRLETVSANAAKKGEVANDRTHQWKAGWKVFLETPSGKGLGTVGNGASLSKVTPFLVGDGVYVRVLAEQGVPGILAFAYLIISIPWILWRYRDIAPVEWRPLGIGLFAFHFGFCIHGIGANTFDYYCVAPVYFMLVGLYVSAAHRQLRENRARAAVSPAVSVSGDAKMLEAFDVGNQRH